jgi:hypothetical protein
VFVGFAAYAAHKDSKEGSCRSYNMPLQDMDMWV